MFEAEVVASIGDISSDVDEKGKRCWYCDLDGSKVVAPNVDFKNLLVERGNWKLVEINVRIIMILIIVWCTEGPMLNPFCHKKESNADNEWLIMSNFLFQFGLLYVFRK